MPLMNEDVCAYCCFLEEPNGNQLLCNTHLDHALYPPSLIILPTLVVDQHQADLVDLACKTALLKAKRRRNEKQVFG